LNRPTKKNAINYQVKNMTRFKFSPSNFSKIMGNADNKDF
jgi:hypothetical protein